ncbi:MAG: hypothetical protein ACTSQZ_07620 [Candidatus Thorarchaeota archaeon]
MHRLILGHQVDDRNHILKLIVILVIMNVIGMASIYTTQYTVVNLGLMVALITGMILGPISGLIVVIISMISLIPMIILLFDPSFVTFITHLLFTVPVSVIIPSFLFLKWTPSKNMRDRTIIFGSLVGYFVYTLGVIVWGGSVSVSPEWTMQYIPLWIISGIIPIILSITLGPRIAFFTMRKSQQQDISEKEISTPIVESRIEREVPLPVIADTPKTEEIVFSKEDVVVKSGVDTAGENLKVGIKVLNEGRLAITNVTVTLDAPQGLEFTKGTAATIRLGSVSPKGGFQSAIFWLKPTRCIDDSYSGIISYRDATDVVHTLDIPKKRLVNICPMLEDTSSPQEIFTECKYGGLQRNSASFDFSGDPAMVFQLAKSRVAALIPADKMEQNVGENQYLAYICVVGKTKFGENKFAAEIQVSGNPKGGVLTLNIYSDDERILSGFFVDIMTEVRQHVQILKENSEITPTKCPHCSAPLDLQAIDEKRIFECESCGIRGLVPPWMVT